MIAIREGSLLPHQEAGADLISDRNGTLLLADEMGVGKTRTAVAAAAKTGNLPCVIVCPVQVKYTWVDEIAAVCADAKSCVISGRDSKKCAIRHGFDFYIINREIFASRLEELKALNPRQLIIDEAHQIGGYKTAILKALFRMSEHVRKIRGGVLPLTGTPITNDYTDIHRIFCIMSPGVFGNKTAFESKYCPEIIFKEKIFGGMFRGKPRWMVAKEYNDAKKKGLVPKATPEAIEELSRTVRRWWLRRTRKSVWKVIPHDVHMWRIEVDDEEVLEADKEARSALSKGASVEDGAFAHIRRLVAEAKIPVVLQWIHNFMAGTDEKLIIMCWHIEVGKQIQKEFGAACVTIAGDAESKKKAENAFQKDPSVRLCVCNVKASTGVTLTAARTILFAEMPWTWSDFCQAKDRVNRIGQEAESLDYTVCIAADTVEEIVWRIVNRKRDLTAKIMGE
jgi:SWI/SNF-related matrix-associated actin-dependent regulator of chromatin subfamily A-like protein 1